MIFFDSSFFDRFFFFLFFSLLNNNTQQKRQITITKCATGKKINLWKTEFVVFCWMNQENNGQVLYIQNQFIVVISFSVSRFAFQFLFLSTRLIWFLFRALLIPGICSTHVSNHQISSFHCLLYFFILTFGCRLFHNISFSCVRHICRAHTNHWNKFLSCDWIKRAHRRFERFTAQCKSHTNLATYTWVTTNGKWFTEKMFVSLFSLLFEIMRMEWKKGCNVFFVLSFLLEDDDTFKSFLLIHNEKSNRHSERTHLFFLSFFYSILNWSSWMDYKSHIFSTETSDFFHHLRYERKEACLKKEFFSNNNCNANAHASNE